MPANEPLMGLPYPLSSDSDDVPRDIKALADAAALKMNMMPRTFATTAARDAFYTANPTLKVAGIVAVIGTGADYAEYVWTGTAWRASGGSGFVTAEAVLSASVTPGSTLADLGSLGVTVANYGPAAVWEVQANPDAEVIANGQELLDIQLYAAGVAQSGELVAICLTGMSGLRLQLSRTWRVTGMPAGPCTLQLRGYQPTPKWRLNATHSHMLVRQVA